MDTPPPVRLTTQRFLRSRCAAWRRLHGHTFSLDRRRPGVALLSVVLSAFTLGTAMAQGHASDRRLVSQVSPRPPAPIERRTPSGPASNPGAPADQGHVRGLPRNGTPGPHAGRGVPLAQWMSQHSQLSPTEQQHALEREPGFRDLPQPTQSRMRQRLSELDNMPPERRERILARNEAMEHLSPDQRSQVRGAMQQLGALPPEQRRPVARAFRELRDLPSEQRAAALSSDRFRGQFSDTQRSTLNNLLRIEPMLPPPDRTPH